MRIAQLETELREHVLLLGKTQAIGNIEAKYNPGRTTYDWEATCLEHPTRVDEAEAWAELKEMYTEYIEPEPYNETDWRGMANRMNWEPVVSKEPVPSVKFNLVE